MGLDDAPARSRAAVGHVDVGQARADDDLERAARVAAAEALGRARREDPAGPSFERPGAGPLRRRCAPRAADAPSLARHVDDLVAIVERLGAGRAHLAGNSSGAFICLLAARRRPDLVRTLTPEEPPVVSLFLRALPPKPSELFGLLFSSPGALAALLAFGAAAIGPANKAFREGRDDAALAYFARGVLGEAAYAKVSGPRRRQMLDNLMARRAALLGSGLPVFTAADAAASGVSTQLVRGADTPAFRRRINRRLAALAPGARDVRVPNASHLVHEDNPRAVAAAILSFCGHRR